MEFAFFDKDLDGILSYVYFQYVTKRYLRLYDPSSHKEVPKLFSFDKGIDILIKQNIQAKRIVIYDHHISRNSDIEKLYKDNNYVEVHLKLFAPSTFSILADEKKRFNPEKHREFIKRYHHSLNYLHKVENEQFEKMNKTEKWLYFFYFNLLDYFKPLGYEVFLDKLENILREKSKSLSREEENRLSLAIQEHFDMTYNSNLNLFFISPRTKEAIKYIPILPYFFRDKQYYLYYKDRVLYRLENSKMFEEIICKFDGGGRKMYGKNRFAGVFYLR
jgi:hypothetical protein